jgi:hypothetical protein
MTPMPPALATALARLVGKAPAIGACRIGTRSPKRRQNRAARSRAPTIGKVEPGLVSVSGAIVQPGSRFRIVF